MRDRADGTAIAVMRAAAFVAVMLSTACARPTPPQDVLALPSGKPGSARADLRDSITVGRIDAEGEIRPLWMKTLTADAFAEILRSMLVEAGLHSTEGPYRLNARLVSVGPAFLGGGPQVTVRVAYRLIGEEASVLWSRDLTTPDAEGAGEPAILVDRGEPAEVVAVRLNIGRALELMAVEAERPWATSE